MADNNKEDLTGLEELLDEEALAELEDIHDLEKLRVELRREVIELSRSDTQRLSQILREWIESQKKD